MGGIFSRSGLFKDTHLLSIWFCWKSLDRPVSFLGEISTRLLEPLISSLAEPDAMAVATRGGGFTRS